MSSQAPRNPSPTDVGDWRRVLQDLDWSQGWSSEELQRRFATIPQQCWMRVPSGQKFYSFDVFWNYFMPAGTEFRATQ